MGYNKQNFKRIREEYAVKHLIAEEAAEELADAVEETAKDLVDAAKDTVKKVTE